MVEDFVWSLSEKDKIFDIWFMKLGIHGTPVKFKVNTGADIRVICHNIYNNLCDKLPLSLVEEIFRIPGSILLCEEKFSASITYRKKYYSFDVYMIND